MSSDEEYEEPSDPSTFWIGPVKCKAQKQWLVSVAVNLPKPVRFVVKISNSQDRRAAVRRHVKFAEVKGLAVAASAYA